MKLKFYHTLFALLLIGCLYACKGGNQNAQDLRDTIAITKLPTEKAVPVKTLILQEQTFNSELLANGKLEAVRKANLRFSLDGIIKDVFVREGGRIQSGGHVARLDNLPQMRTYTQSKLRHSQAQLDYEDQLLRLGFRLEDTSKIDKKVKNIARLRSGLSNSEIELQRTVTDLNSTYLNAPFSGKIANLKAKPYSQSSGLDYACTLIDDTELVVDFLVLEQELDFIRASKTIKIIPFNNSTHSYIGTISSINPIVDKSGMVSVKANVHNTDGQLLDGISVRVIAQQRIPNQLAIPKSALLERQGRKVVFTVRGKNAYWNYVETAYENSSELALKKGLKPGDRVIYDGNFNLAHEKKVEILEEH